MSDPRDDSAPEVSPEASAPVGGAPAGLLGKRKARIPSRRRVSAEEWETIWRGVRDGKGEKEIADSIGRSYSLVSRLIREGDPAAGIKPPRLRLAEIAQRVASIEDLNDAEVFVRQVRVLDGMFGQLATKFLAQMQANPAFPVEARDVVLVAREAREARAAVRAVAGKPTQVVEHRIRAVNTPEALRARQEALSDEDREALARLASTQPDAFADDDGGEG